MAASMLGTLAGGGAPARGETPPAPSASSEAGPERALLTSKPRHVADWPESEPTPEGYHVEMRKKAGQIVAGSILLGVSWPGAFLIGAMEQGIAEREDPSLEYLAIPVVGPLIAMPGRDASSVAVLGLDALAQVGGGALLIHALTTKHRALVRDDLALVTLTPTPMGKDGAGAVMLGRF